MLGRLLRVDLIKPVSNVRSPVRTNTSSQTFTPYTGASFINDCLQQLMLQVRSTASVRWHHGSSFEHCALFYIFFSHGIQ